MAKKKRNKFQAIYLYDKMPDKLTENGMYLKDFLSPPEMNRQINGMYQFYGVYKGTGQFASEIKRFKYVSSFTPEGKKQFFYILDVDKKNKDSITFKALHLGYQANNNFIEDSFTSRGNGSVIMKNLFEGLAFKQKFKYSSDVLSTHQFTAKQVNPIDAIIGSNNGQQNLVGVTKGELDMDNYNLTLKSRIGADNNYRVDFGVNLESVVETIKPGNMCNSLYLVGGVPDDTQYDHEQEPVEFKYLEIEGVNDSNRIIRKRENQDCKTEKELKEWGQSLFDKERVHEPQVTHVINMISLENTEEYSDIYDEIAKANIGDTIYCTLKEMNIEAKERMIEYTYLPTLLKYKQVVIGNEFKAYSQSNRSQITELHKSIIERSESMQKALVEASEMITGNQGGYVVHWPKNNPSDILIMDTPSTDTSKEVLRLNKSGIGFSKNGWLGPYESAWTLDGVFVADFIKAGTLNGVRIQAENNNFLIDMFNGKIRFEDLKTNKKLGQLFPSYDGASDKLNGFAIQQYPGFNFSLNSGKDATSGTSAPVVQIPEDSTSDKRKLNLFGEVRLKGDFYVNDVKIDKNGGGTGGGGGWNGLYPPELTQAFEKYAWQLYQILLSMGYSRESACGILGNVQGEVGPSMNPDTEQVGGPAYGCVQWDGSAYPLVGAPTWNGREYVQRLMDAARIVEDYTTYKAQGPLIDWCMYNGQWIGQVYPTTVTAFKRSADPKTAAHAFEMNFERPKDAHPEREVYAQRWFDKFKDLKQPGGSGKHVKPMNNYTVMSEFGWRDSPLNPGQMEFHNAIDLASNGGNAQIFASQEGEVIQAGAEYFSWYGNYVVIKHPDGTYTGYAHLSQIHVTRGQQVTQGQVIGVEGATGPVTGQHLHYQVMTYYWPRDNNDFKNPREYVSL